ncbi:hypothetical protein GCM10007860_34290 [Chitiniphilus shinanonensis]|uniref:Lipoprotein n=1 Tax=Chitiniphilus shinanonensis TaxID=553088 RepID=A0ABQ6BWY8_9NEIS|nr:hypothetical protein [Chitiniphilus shinanonensis]GLS06253.1 hypothetical protein GCM10007860_34290 [Chitiniphilus shinanonensis]
MPHRPLRRRFASLCAVLCLLLLSACATPSLTNAWKDPNFAGPPAKRVLVLGISNSDAHRRIFEDAFVQALREHGVDAVPAYPKLPERGEIARDRIQAAVAASGADAVLVTRPIKVEHQVDVSPAPSPMGWYGTGFYGWYGAVWAAQPATVTQYDVLTLESTLWNLGSEHVTWSGTTKSIESDDIARFTARLAKVLIEQMRRDGVL